MRFSLFYCRRFGSLSSHYQYINYLKQNKHITKWINYDSNVKQKLFKIKQKQKKKKQIFDKTDVYDVLFKNI